MAARWLAATFLASILVPLLEALFPGMDAGAGSRAALALGPWLLLAPLPRAGNGAGERSLDAVLVTGALSLPALLLGAGLDLARGASPRELLEACGVGWSVLLLWCAAASRWAATGPRRGVFPLLWFLLFPGLAVLDTALDWVPRRTPGNGEKGGLFYALDPWIWWHRWARAGGLSSGARAEDLAVVLGALLGFLLVVALARRARAERFA